MPARVSQRSSGVHLLESRSHLRSLVEAADLGPNSLVFDLGAGPGTLTTHLARTGARVIAIERSSTFLSQLRRRFADHSNVRVVAGDLREVPFPHRPFQIVASIPFGLSTPLLRRLLGTRTTRLGRADLVVEWGFAKRMLEPTPRGRELERWRSRFEFTLVRRIPATAFRPTPAVDCAHLAITRRHRRK